MTYIIVEGGVAFLCGRCGRISHNPNDVAERYCAACKLFHQEKPKTDHDQLIERLVNALIDQEPVFYELLAIGVRGGMTFDQIDNEVIKTIATVGTNRYNAAYLTAEWLIQQREVAKL